MKVWGALVLILYTALALNDWGFDSDDERGQLPPDVRRTSGGILLWHSGYMGGK